MLQLNWNAIVDRFALKFDAAFSTCSKKAHFDCVPPESTVIDGARSKWCHLLLVNAIVGILDFESFNLASRRKFNQQKVLCECILQEIDSLDPDADKSQVFAVVDSTWSDLSALRTFLDSNAPYKSKDKYFFIMNVLLSHQVLAELNFNLEEAVNVAVRKILEPDAKSAKKHQFSSGCSVPVPTTGSNKRRSPHFDEISPKKPCTHENDSLSSTSSYGYEMSVKHENPQPSLSIDSVEGLEGIAEAAEAAEAAEVEKGGRRLSFDASTVFYDPKEALLGAELMPDSNPWDLLDADPQRLPPMHLPIPHNSMLRLTIDAPNSNSPNGRPNSSRPASAGQTVHSSCGSSPTPSLSDRCSSPLSPFLPIRSPHDTPIPQEFRVPFPLVHDGPFVRRCYSTGSSPVAGAMADPPPGQSSSSTGRQSL